MALSKKQVSTTFFTSRLDHSQGEIMTLLLQQGKVTVGLNNCEARFSPQEVEASQLYCNMLLQTDNTYLMLYALTVVFHEYLSSVGLQ